MKPTADILPVAPDKPDAEVIARAAHTIRTGGLVVFPTYGLYGLGADAFNPSAVERIFRIKGRPAVKALLVLVETVADLQRITEAPSPLALKLMQRFWPGRVTFILPARRDLPSGITSTDGKIGVRLISHPVAAALVRAAAVPLTGTSANISGTGGCSRVAQIDTDLIRKVDLVLDAGPLAGGPGSTVVDVTGDKPLVLRQGAVAAARIMEAFKSGF